MGGSIFIEKEDVAIRIMLTLFIYGELYMAIWLMSFYKNNYEWYKSIARYIYGSPALWMISISWSVVYFLLGSSLYLFYRNSSNMIGTSHFDLITFLFIVNIALNKLYPFVFIHLKKTLLSLIMLVIIVMTSALTMILFAMNDKWSEFGYMIPYPLFNLYLLYINFNWVRVEQATSRII